MGNWILSIKNISIIPFLSHRDVVKLLNCADILLIPNSNKFDCSNKYTSPMKLFEYMAVKKPIIASDVVSIKKIVSENEVFFFKADDFRSLIKVIKDVLLKNEEVNLKVKNSFKLVQKYSTIERARIILKNEKK